MPAAESKKATDEDEEAMWQRACFLTRLVSSSVRIAERAGQVIKDTMRGGDLKIIDKAEDGEKADLQTEADRAAQYCIVHSLHRKFGDKLNVIGEEDHTSFVLQLETQFANDVLQFDGKCTDQMRHIEVTVWVDPLDGTSEFAEAARSKSPLLQQVTVLIGVGYKGRAIAGVIHQPYYGENQSGRTIWAIDGIGTHGIDIVKRSSEKVIVTTRSHSSKLVMDALDALKQKGLADTVQPVGGAGYKVLRCLEGATAYVFASHGCKKWDTAAPEAIICAAGGSLTDISGRIIYYGADAQKGNTGGVLATAPGVNHQEYVDNIPTWVKESLPEFAPKH